ncbi:UNVERIFIED_CONTAM: Trihelix transcription factor ASIL1 [Sesamum radiatum]|uniref:Trihelix transcription factor ASIL1 n=1 Tax=Sesamum radiatum TaxID=300843 RepID=A0AAW2R022_SESRA
MAAILSPSSNSPHDHDHDHDDDHIPTATLALPSIATASASRRLPPPCWSPDETVALIDAYRDKWYSLRRGNLRANHWQEVADDVASRCPASPPKTAVQCRHKMEKLRKRYRAEIQRAAAHGGVRRFTSSWVHFQRMHSMEKGPNPSPPSSDDEEEDDHKTASNESTICIIIIIKRNPNYPNPRFAHSVAGVNGAASSKVLRDGFVGRGEVGKRVGEISKKNKGDGVGEVVAAIQALGEGFMRVEKVKMDMVRQVEEMRMEMELKRTEMILESQQRIVEAFAKAISERSTKRVKRNSTPPDC